MLRSSVWGLVFSLLTVLPTPALAQDWAQKMFETSAYDFGQVARNAKAEYAFVLSNPFLEDAHIASAQPSCGCTSLRIENPFLKTYEKGAVVAVFNTTTFRGQHGATITVTLDRPFYAIVQLQVRGYVRDDVTLTPESVDLGTVDQGAAAERRVSIRFTSSNGWEIRGVHSANPHLSAQVVETGRDYSSVAYELRVRLDEHAPVGYIKDHLMLVTNDARATQFPVLVQGRIMAPVTVSPASLFLGILRPGESVAKRLVVQGKKPFRVTSVTSAGTSFKLTANSDDQGTKLVHVLSVTFVAGNVPGQAAQMVRIQTDLEDKPSELPTYVVVSP